MDIDGRMPKDLTDRIDRSDMVKVTVREENLLDREAPGPDRVRDLIGRGARINQKPVFRLRIDIEIGIFNIRCRNFDTRNHAALCSYSLSKSMLQPSGPQVTPAPKGPRCLSLSSSSKTCFRPSSQPA